MPHNKTWPSQRIWAKPPLREKKITSRYLVRSHWLFFPRPPLKEIFLNVTRPESSTYIKKKKHELSLSNFRGESKMKWQHIDQAGIFMSRYTSGDS